MLSLKEYIEENTEHIKIGNIYSRHGSKHKVTKITQNSVHHDRIDEKGEPLEKHSGERGYITRLSTFKKEYV